MTLAFAGTGWAAAPPVPQTMGQYDGSIGAMSEADCRLCHDGAGASGTEATSTPDRHHMLYVEDPGTYTCVLCHGETFNVERDCTVCHTSSPHHATDDAVNRQCTACHGDIIDDYDDTHYIPTYAPSLVTPKTGLHGDGYYDNNPAGTRPETENLGTGALDVAAGGPIAATAGTPDTHASDANRLGLILTSSGPDNDIEIDHTGRYSDGTFNVTVVHAAGAPTAVWSADASDYGLLTITFESGVTTATAMVAAITGATGTPAGNELTARLPHTEGEGTGVFPLEHYEELGGSPLNSEGFGSGSCSYCHDADAGLGIQDNHDTHHGISLPYMVKAGTAAVPNPGGVWPKCNMCHDYTGRGGTYHDNGGATFALHIRVCEECHGPDSLHNIQVDSPAAPTGTIVVGGEDAGYGHIGRDAGPGDSDCWGCHGFSIGGMAPSSGPLIPAVYGTDVGSITAGTDTTVVLTGAAFTNYAGPTLYESSVALTAADGSSVTLTPDLMDQGLIAVTIPADTAPGNYDLQAVKDEFKSNPAPLSIVPKVAITRALANGPVTIRGQGFGGYAEGATFVSTTVVGKAKRRNGKRKRTTEVGTIVSWTDKKIVAQFASSPDKVTVHSIFGDASSAVTAKASKGKKRR